MRILGFNISRTGPSDVHNRWTLKDIWSTYFSTVGTLNSVNTTKSQRIAAVFLSLKILSETLAHLPWLVMQDTADGSKVRRKDSPVYYCLSTESNSIMTSYDFIHAMVWNVHLYGNSIAIIRRDILQDCTELEFVKYGDYTIKEYDGELYYQIKGKVYNQNEILHFKVNSLDGKVGRSTISTCNDTFATAEHQKEFSTKSLAERPPGFLSFAGKLNPDQRKENQAQWKVQVSGGTPVLDGDWKYNPLSLPPADAQLIESKKMTVNEIYSLFRIPPTYAQNYERATYANAEQQDLVLVKHTIAPLVVSMEQEMTRKLFRPSNKVKQFSLYVNAELKGLLRADIKTRSEFYTSMWSKGVFSANDILLLEDMPIVPGGERRFIQSGFIPTDRVDDFVNSKIKDTSSNTTDTNN